MNALLNPTPLCAYAPRPEDPDITNGRIVEAELQRLVDAETFNEHGQDREFMQLALKIMARWWGDRMRWTDALVDVQYAATWNDAAFDRLRRDGDKCEMGNVMHRQWLIEFAADVFAAAEEAWNA